MKKQFLNLVFGLIILSSASAQPQTDSTNINNDSINASILANYNQQLLQIEQQRLADSVKKAELEIELSSLKTTDNLKKEELQKQLEEISKQEENRLAQKKAKIDSLRSTAKGFPVLGFFNDTLFTIYNKSGSFSAKERALAIANKIKNLSDVFGFKEDSLKLIPSEATLDLIYDETIIISISESDALWNNVTKQELGSTYKTVIAQAVLNYKSETSVSTLAKEIGLALLVLIITGFLLFYIGKLFKWTATKIEEQEDKKIKGIKIKNYTLFDAKRQINALLTLNTLLKWVVILLVIYIALPILFGIFPWTKDLAQTLFGYILNPVKRIASGLWNYLPNLITILVIVFVFRYVFRGLAFLKNEVENGNLTLPGFYTDWANPTYQIVKVIVFAFMLIVIFPYLPGSDSPIFQGVSVFLGFLFTFGSAGSLSNVIAGLVLTYMRLFKIGDRVKIGEVVGDVIEKSLLVTRVRTIKNEIISIPNSTVMNSHTVNYSSDAPEKGLIIHSTVTIGYDVPWRDTQQALIDAALKTELILKEPTPFVLQTSLDDFYVSYQINAYVREANKQASIYSALHQNIQDVFNERGIEILSPHYRAARDGNMTTIPANYLDKDYKAPTFNVNVKKD
ncbi:MAG: mechanosensitive ion channel [Flavobacteriales bacterium]|nr:mechanosensitive ion channel [Flavobacteriales bacterium]